MSDGECYAEASLDNTYAKEVPFKKTELLMKYN